MRNSGADKVIYQVFTRNYSEEGTFKKVEEDLDRIVDLGVDILYLMPVQPIGEVGRKGTLGSPYSISDFRAINPELGDWNSFRELVDAAHKKGLRVIVDQVFNHSSRDNALIESNPDFYWHDADGNLGNKAGDWSDVYDLNHGNQDLEDSLIGTLDLFLKAGVDGFRFDVASLIPASFFRKFKEFREKNYPDRDITMLAECIDTPFVLGTRADGFNADSNSELFDAGFDLFYDYASFPWFRKYMRTRKETDLAAYAAALSLETASLPARGAAVVRTLENHDQPRLSSYSKGEQLHHNLLAFSFFTKGPAFVYNGMEYGISHQPSLFDKDTIPMGKEERPGTLKYIKKLMQLKRREKNLQLVTTLYQDAEGYALTCVNRYEDGSEETGVFNLSENPIPFPFDSVKEGTYTDILTRKEIVVKPGETLDLTEPLYLSKKA